MKLLNVPGCLFPGPGGNVKEQTMIVEVHGTGFWTRVRFPPGPPNSANPNSFFFVKHCVGFVFIVEDVG